MDTEKVGYISPAPDGWVKKFEDGSYENGYDHNSYTSWSKGRLDGMVGAWLYCNGEYVGFSSETPTEFWQSDVYEAVVGQSEPKLVKRRLQMKQSNDTWLTLELDPNTMEFDQYIVDNKL